MARYDSQLNGSCRHVTFNLLCVVNEFRRIGNKLLILSKDNIFSIRYVENVYDCAIKTTVEI